ncbi:MAG: DUF1592 domain-containing protein [Myxococcales bacterium]|nr:MAG: DUF1592 domain-containing protein [Myxococcales bacterium]
MWVGVVGVESARGAETQTSATAPYAYKNAKIARGLRPIRLVTSTHLIVRTSALPAAWLSIVTLAACTARVEGPVEVTPPGSGASSSGGSSSAAGSGGVGVGAAAPATDPGRVTLHRLNRVEYGNTLRDLIGAPTTVADDLPIDDRGSGFDNMADVLTVSPLHVSVFHAAAKKVAADALADPARRASVVTCDLAQGEACMSQVLKGFAERAWRRPVTEGELTRLQNVVGTARTSGDSAEVGLGLALRAVLLSPHFVFRVELDPEPTSATPHPLSPYELASRLSYFLWSSMPDAALFQAAQSGALSDPTALSAEARRLLADPRARALVDNFAGQWLHLRAIDGLQPDPTLFPDVDAPLLRAMKEESERLFSDIAFQRAPLLDLLTASYGYVNDRLASHYGLPAVGSNELTRVDLSNNAQRDGFLTHGGFLSLTSHVNRTSPVVRGKWVMDELLCAAVPAPPPDVNLAAVSMAKEQGLTQRQALEQHRADPKCFACHTLMDPIGLGLENYDAIGVYREQDAGHPIDASGQLPSGEGFSGAKQLSALIAGKPEFLRCAAKKLYTYALGRPPVDAPGHMDATTLANLNTALAENQYAFDELLVRIVTSAPFTSRRGEPGGTP